MRYPFFPRCFPAAIEFIPISLRLLHGCV
jgi:hypothetical protein